MQICPFRIIFGKSVEQCLADPLPHSIQSSRKPIPSVLQSDKLHVNMLNRCNYCYIQRFFFQKRTNFHVKVFWCLLRCSCCLTAWPLWLLLEWVKKSSLVMSRQLFRRSWPWWCPPWEGSIGLYYQRAADHHMRIICWKALVSQLRN